MQEFFVDVLLPLPVRQVYTYRIPSSLNKEISIGKRVIVPFGKNKIYSAVITGIHKKTESSLDIKDIQSVVDEHPVVNDHQIRFWQWMADYYMCTKGEVMNSALPASLKMESETKIMLVDDADERKDLSDNEEIIADALKSRKE